MEGRSSTEINISLTRQEIFRILGNVLFRYCVQKDPHIHTLTQGWPTCGARSPE